MCGGYNTVSSETVVVGGGVLMGCLTAVWLTYHKTLFSGGSRSPNPALACCD